MTIQEWVHKFPKEPDQTPIFVDYPDPDADTMFNSTWQKLFNSLISMQIYMVNWVKQYITWGSIDGYTAGVVGIGHVHSGGFTLDCEAAAGLNDYAYLYSKEPYREPLESGKLFIAEWVINYISGTSNQITKMYFVTPVALPPSDTAKHFGFKSVNGTLYATTGTGVAETATNTGVELNSGNQTTRLKVVVDLGVDCKFYVNGVLKATHTTNLPPIDNYWLVMGLQNTATSLVVTFFGRVLVAKEG